MNTGPPRIFDREALARARVRAERMRQTMFLAAEAGEGIAARIAPINKPLIRAVDIDGLAAAQAVLRPLARQWSQASLSNLEVLETSERDVDLVTSVLGLQTVNDLPGALVQIRRLLKPDGVFAAALFGGATLQELRDSLTAAEIELTGGASPRVSPFADVRDLGNLLQRAQLALPVADTERTTVLYRDFHQLVADLRAHGQTNVLFARGRKPISRRLLAATIDHYAAHHAEPDGKLRATFEIIYAVSFAPADNQPKPLKPGSAKSRLADALGAKEHSAGEATGTVRKDQT
jgi:SAM-dependent methyltransferase